MKRRWTAHVAGACFFFLLAWAWASEHPVDVARFAPLGDLQSQLDHYLTQLQSDLSDEQQYDEVRQSRVAKDSNTVIVLAQALGRHPEDSPEKKASLAMVLAALELASQVDDFQGAREALDALKAARQTTGEPAAFAPVADLAELMKQVPVVNNSLRAGVNSRRFERSAKRSTGYAATLAAIAHASSLDTGYCVDEEDEQLWEEICLKMRDATADVLAAVQENDQPKAQAALAVVVETCDECHHRFRD